MSLQALSWTKKGSLCTTYALGSPGLTARLRFAGQLAEPSGGLIIPVVVAIPHQDQNLSNARARQEEIDETLHALGLEGDSRIRVDRSLSEGIRQAALENNASMVLLSWQGPRAITTIFVESMADEVNRLVDCPVAVAALSESSIDQVMLAISKQDLIPSRLERIQAAASIANALMARKPLIVGPADSSLLAKSGVSLSEKAEHKPGDTSTLRWIDQNIQSNSLIVTVAGGWALNRFVTEFYQRDCSIVSVTVN